MKKLLSLFGALTIIGTSATTSVSCDKTPNTTAQEVNHDPHNDFHYIGLGQWIKSEYTTPVWEIFKKSDHSVGQWLNDINDANNKTYAELGDNIPDHLIFYYCVFDDTLDSKNTVLQYGEYTY